MEDYEYFNRWPDWVRWILFLPMGVVGYLLAYFLGKFALWYGYGWLGISDNSALGYVINGLHINLACFFFAFVLSVACAPKGRIIIQSIYLGSLLFIMGFSSLSIIIYGEASGAPAWVVVFDFLMNLLAGVTVLWMVIYDYNLNKKTAEEESAVFTQ